MIDDKRREYDRDWKREKYRTDPEYREKCRLDRLAYREKHKERLLEEARQRYKDNPEYTKKHSSLWHEKNRERSLENKREWNKKNRERISAKDRALRETSPEVFLLSGAKTRASKRGLEFDLVLEDIKVPAVCPLLEIPLVIGQGKVAPGSPSLDRIDNGKGYVKGNVWVISYQANSMKNNSSAEELRAFCTNVLRHLDERLL